MTKKILAVHIGNRGKESAKKRIDQVPNMKIYCTGEGEAYYPVTFNGVTEEHMIISSATTIVQEIDILVHGDNFPTMLSTPFQKLELK